MTGWAPAGDRITDVAGIAVGHHHLVDADATLGLGGPDDPPGTGWATGTTVVVVSTPIVVLSTVCLAATSANRAASELSGRASP